MKLLKNGFLVSMINRTMKLDTLSGSNLWEGYDVLIFNSYHWWLHSGRLKTWVYSHEKSSPSSSSSYLCFLFQMGLLPDRQQHNPWHGCHGSIQDGSNHLGQVGRLQRRSNPNPCLLPRDFNSSLPVSSTSNILQMQSHVLHCSKNCADICCVCVCISGVEWDEPSVQDCRGQTKPIERLGYPGSKPPGDAVVRSVLSSMDKPATLLDILLLTQLRKDGHPSTYAGGALDCSHWCLAGVPDTWNQLLYTILLQS